MKNRPRLANLLLSPILLAPVIALLAACSPQSEPDSLDLPEENLSSDDPIVVYSSRNEHLISPVFALFTKETGINVIAIVRN